MLCCVDTGAGYIPLGNVGELEQIKMMCSVLLPLVYISVWFSKHFISQFESLTHMSSSEVSVRHGQWFKSLCTSLCLYCVGRVCPTHAQMIDKPETSVNSQIYGNSLSSHPRAGISLYSPVHRLYSSLFLSPEKGGSSVTSTTGKWLNDWGLPSKARL